MVSKRPRVGGGRQTLFIAQHFMSALSAGGRGLCRASRRQVEEVMVGRNLTMKVSQLWMPRGRRRGEKKSRRKQWNRNMINDGASSAEASVPQVHSNESKSETGCADTGRASAWRRILAV